MIGLFDPRLLRKTSVIRGNQNSVSLKEVDAGAALKELVVTHVPAGALVCDLDPIKPSAGKRPLARYSWFFDSCHPIAAKQCDGAIYFTHLDIEYLFLIELKSSASTLTKGRRQLESGAAFAKYIEALLGRPLRVCTRLVFVGPPKPPLTFPVPPSFPEHMELPVLCNRGCCYLSMSQLIG